MLRFSTGLTLFFALGVLGCNPGKKEAERLEGIQKSACECSDNDCAKKAFGDFKGAVQEMKDNRANEENSKRIQEASKQITICLMKNGIGPGEITGALK